MTAMGDSYLVSEAVTMKVYGMQVYFIAHSHHIPIDFISYAHCEAL